MTNILLYTEAGSHLNICGPFITIGIWVDPDVEILLSQIVKEFLFNPQSDKRIRNIKPSGMLRTIGALERIQSIHSYKAIPPPFIISSLVTFAEDITQQGFNCSIVNAQRRVCIQLKSKLLSQLDIEVTSIPIIELEKDIKTTIGLIAYSYANMLRQRWFDNYHSLYPSLGLKSNVGHVNPKHISELIKLKYLPTFYIWSRTLQAVTKLGIDSDSCIWLKKEIQAYEHVKRFS